MENDLSSMSDEQLQSIANSAPDLSQVSDEELQRLASTPEPPSRTESFLRGAEQGATLGYAGPIARGLTMSGLAEANLYGGLGLSPEEILAAGTKVQTGEEEAIKAARGEHPGYFFTGNVAGGLANPLVGALPAGATTGAAVGAISGASEGDTLTERAKGALVGGVSGGVLGSVLGNIFKGRSPETQQAIEQAKSMGIDIPYYAATPSLGVHSATNVVKNIPVVGTPVEEAAEKTISQMGKAADNLGGISPEAAGTIFGDALKKWIRTDSEKIADQYYTAVSNHMDPNILTPLDNTAKTVSDIMARRAEAAIPGSSGASKMVLPAIQTPDGLSYAGIKNLRTFVRENLDTGILPADVSGSELKQIYGALSADLDAAAKNAGGQYGQELHNKANEIYRALSAKREALTPLIGGNAASASPENVFSNILNAASSRPGSSDLSLLRQAKSVMSPDEWSKASSGAIAQMGRDADGNFSPARFMGPNGFNKFSPEGKDILFGPTGTPMRDGLETLANVSRQFKAVQKYANTSGTAHGVVGVEMLKALANEPISIIAQGLGGRQVAQMLSNPATTQALGNWSLAYLQNLRNAPITSALGLASEGTARGSLAALKAATQNLATIHAKETGQAAAGLTKGIWGPVASQLGYKGDDAMLPDQGRIQRKSGGRIQSGHQHLVDRLFRLGEQAKKTEKAHTEPLLNLPDETVAKALDVAQRAI
jgi:hypothetical protein